MGYVVAVGPTAEPITLDEAMQHCRVTNEAEMGLMAGYILAARSYVENDIRRKLLTQTIDCTFDFAWPYTRLSGSAYFLLTFFYWRQRIELPCAPVQSVTWVNYLDQNGVPQTLDPSQYSWLNKGPVSLIEPAFGVSWPAPRYVPECIQIRFVAGYGDKPSDIPETIRQAMLMLIAHWYDHRGSEQFGAGRGGLLSGTTTPSEIPPGVEALLSQERVSRILP